MKSFVIAFLLFFTLCGCEKSPQSVSPYTKIAGRENDFLYQARIPAGWKMVKIEKSGDTTKPLCEFTIDDKIRVTVHNFPCRSLDERISSQANISRWSQQYPEDNHIEPISHDGFYGVKFRGKREDEMALGWSMGLDDYLFQKVVFYENSPKESLASYTIKATGKSGDIEKYEDEILSFEKSFHLICPIPH